MQCYKGFEKVGQPPQAPVVVTIGNFDGVHFGHQQIIGKAKEEASSRKGSCVVFTFHPHPQLALRPEKKIPLILTYSEKIKKISELGVDVIVEQPFSREFSNTSPQEFFSKILVKTLNASAIVVGYDFAFGKQRGGHLESLSELCKNAGVNLTVVQPQKVEDETVSSSLIRKCLLEGEIEKANSLLGYPFFYSGIVTKGEGRGRKMGIPTANLSIEEKLTLFNGVYATLTVVGGKELPGVTNVGVRPTFEGATERALVETHLFDIDLDLYGKSVEVRFLKKIREEKKFNSPQELAAQIQQDIIAAQGYLDTHSS